MLQIVVGKKRQRTAGPGVTLQRKKKKAGESDPMSSVGETHLSAHTSSETYHTPGIDPDMTRPQVNIEIGSFAALRLKEYDDEVPQIAKVTAWMWTLSGGLVGTMAHGIRGHPNLQTVHKNTIIMAPISLTRSNRLSNNTILQLKKIYEDVEFM